MVCAKLNLFTAKDLFDSDNCKLNEAGEAKTRTLVSLFFSNFTSKLVKDLGIEMQIIFSYYKN